jgi:LacI family transcriptional regulator
MAASKPEGITGGGTMARSARMSDVARLAQVSTMTVSRVLNENPNVLDETRQRVFAAIEQLGYRRNELARSLRERRSRQIGILVPNLYDPFFALCAHTVSAVAKEHSYAVSIATTDEDPEAEFDEASRMALRHTEGLIAIPAEAEPGTSRLLAPELESMVMVVLDRPIPGGEGRADTLLVQNRRGAQIGTEHLLSLGHKRVAFVGFSGHLYTMRKRRAGYRQAMELAGIRPLAVAVPPAPGVTQARVRELLASKNPPTALFCANNLITLQTLHVLGRMGVQSPGDLALLGFDDFATADLLRPGISVVRQPVESMARLAAEVLFARLAEDRPGTPPRRIVLPVELIVRGSCGARAPD